ncbi:MAG: PLD nuclease N-terminal domain-containing protein [Colwellia polaris]
MKFMFTGILGLIHLIIAIWAILSILKSSASTAEKIVWALVVLLFPVIGLIIWFLAGPK